MEQKTLDLKTVCECNRCLGVRTLHPQATLINLENPGVQQSNVKFEFYAILLIEDRPGSYDCCGRKYYDYTNASMVFLKPGEIFHMSKAQTLPDKGWLLAFHPDLLFRTTLKNHIDDYTFFGYRKEEALHLSQRETATITCCLEHIEEELHHPIDTHTSTILSRHIELMLDYCSRFYERQFITRENRNKDLMKTFAKLTEAYLTAGKADQLKIPQPELFAQKLHLSTAYFLDLLKFETGKTLAEYFQLKRMEVAKKLLVKKEGTPAEIAYRLGFPSVQYFSSLFKRLTGVAPSDYCYSRN